MTSTLYNIAIECKTWCPPRIGPRAITEPLQTYRKGQSNAPAAKIMTLVGQGKAIKTKLLKPHKFGRDTKDRSTSEAEPYKADKNDGVGL